MQIGQHYYIQTPTWHYCGTLVAFDLHGLTLKNAVQVNETGPLSEMAEAGKPRDYEPCLAGEVCIPMLSVMSAQPFPTYKAEEAR